MRQQVFQNGFWRKQLFEIFDIEKPYGKIMRCALFEILYFTEVYLITD